MQRSRARISGPLLDRLDLHVSVPRVEFKSLREPSSCRESRNEAAARVIRTRELQTQRQGACNAHLDNAAVETGRAILAVNRLISVVGLRLCASIG